MSTTDQAPLLDPAPPRWWEQPLERLRGGARRRRLLNWLAPTIVMLVAAITRLPNLAHPHDLMLQFDETYYVKDAWTLLNLGYEGSWPSDGSELFLAGDVNAFSTDPSFVVHPPLGKWIIALGMIVFGPETGWGWRIMVALLGVASVALVIVIGKRLTGSMLVGSLAGFFLAIDGVSIVLSRVALLDGVLTFFVLLGVLFIVFDREHARNRLLDRMAARVEGGRSPAWGPVLWNRPWIIAAGAALGAATAVKWSGLYVIAAFGIYLVVTDALWRRRAGVWVWPADAMFRQGPVTFVLFVPVAVVVYLASWTGWFLTDGGYDRHSGDNALASLWKYHEAIYGFHIGLTTEHAYASPAWQWPLLLRPTSMYYRSIEAGTDGCAGPGDCVQAISSIPNPVLWWAGVAAVLYLLVRVFLRRDWQSALVLTGVAATYVPWLFFPERTIFQFYTVVIVPFMMIALAMALRDLAAPRDPDRLRRTLGQWVVIIAVVVFAAFSVWYYPVWTAMTVPYDFWYLHFRISDSWV